MPISINLPKLVFSWSVSFSHYNDVVMGKMASQIISLTIVYSPVYLSADLRKHQSSRLLAFVRGFHRGPVNSPHKGPVTRKMFPFDNVIMSELVPGKSYFHLVPKQIITTTLSENLTQERPSPRWKNAWDKLRAWKRLMRSCEEV